jgi:UDP-N-acetylglucosamine:LPS N-acetylglucosamine transferase
MTSAAKRALLVYSRVGGGHLSAARALAEELEAAGVSTRLVDAYVECGRFPVTLFPAAYAELARYHPRLWSMVYRGTEKGLRADRILGPFLREGLTRIVKKERPDLVISTLPVVNGLLAEATAGTGARLEVVLTDWHSVHRFWVASGVHHFTAPTDSARLDCIRFGAPPESVDVVGIPVRRAFATRSQPHENKKFTILAMVGAEGSPRALRNVARLAQLDLDAQLLVICGRNEQLRQRVERLSARMPLQALGFVDNVAELMRTADVLVTKAGGLTLAEAFCCGAPVVVHDVLPGQEAGNLEYILGHQAVEYAPTPTHLGQLITELYADSARRAALASSGARLAQPDAARRIVANVLKRLLDPPSA